jgi:hypothetical protein
MKISRKTEYKSGRSISNYVFKMTNLLNRKEGKMNFIIPNDTKLNKL